MPEQRLTVNYVSWLYQLHCGINESLDALPEGSNTATLYRNGHLLDHKIIAALPTSTTGKPWYVARVALSHDISDPLFEQQITEWLVSNCKAKYIYYGGFAMFEDQAEAALFKLFWA
jgi:hypothetical protein